MLSDKNQFRPNYLFPVLRVMLAICLALTFTPAYASQSVTGLQGQILTISSNVVSPNQVITVSGKGFDETVGVYLAYCKLPKKGALPTPCGGGINKSGLGNSSYWISSNPPPYGDQLAIPFLPGGRFSQKVSVTEKIGKVDCRKETCAITVRADHLREGDRSHDLFIPISFKKNANSRKG